MPSHGHTPDCHSSFGQPRHLGTAMRTIVTPPLLTYSGSRTNTPQRFTGPHAGSHSQSQTDPQLLSIITLVLGSPCPHCHSHTLPHVHTPSPSHTPIHLHLNTHTLPWVTPSHNTKAHVSPAPRSCKHLAHISVSHSHVSPAPFPTIGVQAMDVGSFRS